MLTDVKRGDFTERWSRQTLNISPTTNLLRQDYKSGYCSHQNYIKWRLKKKRDNNLDKLFSRSIPLIMIEIMKIMMMMMIMIIIVIIKLRQRFDSPLISMQSLRSRGHRLSHCHHTIIGQHNQKILCV